VAQVRPGGLLLISIRDYDEALLDRASSTSRVFDGPPRRVDLRVYDWEPDSPGHTVHVLPVSESGAGWTVSHHEVRYRALTRLELTQVAKRVGFSGATWHDPAHVGYYQPVFTAICPEVRLKEHS
jgi:glycine/sarcosine N-methyltransferase